MRKIYFYLLAIMLFTSCLKTNKKLNVYNYSLRNNITEKISLKVNNHKNVISFEYIFNKNTFKNKLIKYNKKRDFLIYGTDTLRSTNKVYNSKSNKFKVYQVNESRSHKSILLFNEKYGVFSNIGSKNPTLYLKDSISNIDSKAIFKEIFLQLNKIDI